MYFMQCVFVVCVALFAFYLFDLSCLLFACSLLRFLAHIFLIIYVNYDFGTY